MGSLRISLIELAVFGFFLVLVVGVPQDNLVPYFIGEVLDPPTRLGEDGVSYGRHD